MTAQVDFGDPELGRLDVATGDTRRFPRIAIGVRSTVVSRRLAAVAVAAVTGCTLLIALLHVVTVDPPLDPVVAPISNYALRPTGWLFDVAVVLLVIGVAALLGALVIGRWLAPGSESFALLTMCCLGLITIVAFPNQTAPDGSLTAQCRIHWAAAMVAFAGIPATALLLGRRHASPFGCGGLPGLITRLSLVASGWFALYFLGTVIEMCTPVRFWPVGGALERALALTDMLIVLVLAVAARRACGCERIGVGPIAYPANCARIVPSGRPPHRGAGSAVGPLPADGSARPGPPLDHAAGRPDGGHRTECRPRRVEPAGLFVLDGRARRRPGRAHLDRPARDDPAQ